MPERNEAQIIVGASPVAAGRRHTYLLFEYSDGRQIVVRGGPDARSEGNDIANLAGSTHLGSENFGKIRVAAAPYVAPYEAADRMHVDGSREPIPVAQVQADDKQIKRDANGKPITHIEIEKSANTQGAFYMRGDHTTGYGVVKVAQNQPSPDRQQLESENQMLNQQRDQARTTQQQQVNQPGQPGPVLG